MFKEMKGFIEAVMCFCIFTIIVYIGVFTIGFAWYQAKDIAQTESALRLLEMMRQGQE